MEIRINMNIVYDNNLKHSDNLGKDVRSIDNDKPLFDYIDDEIVWIWLKNNICIEFSKKEIIDILNGFGEIHYSVPGNKEE